MYIYIYICFFSICVISRPPVFVFCMSGCIFCILSATWKWYVEPVHFCTFVVIPEPVETYVVLCAPGANTGQMVWWQFVLDNLQSRGLVDIVPGPFLNELGEVREGKTYAYRDQNFLQEDRSGAPILSIVNHDG